MLKHLKYALSLMLAIVLCFSGVPASILAEEEGEVQDGLELADDSLLQEEASEDALGEDGLVQDATAETSADQVQDAAESPGEVAETAGPNDSAGDLASATVAVLVHHEGEETIFEQLVWSIYGIDANEGSVVALKAPAEAGIPAASEDEAAEESSPAAVDYLALRLDGSEGSIEYRVRGMADDWPEEWAASGEKALHEGGIGVVQARLCDELGASYELWYRAKTYEGAWLAWTCDGESAGSELAPIVDFQAILLPKGHEAPSTQSEGEPEDAPSVALEQAAEEDTDTEDSPEEAVAEQEPVTRDPNDDSSQADASKEPAQEQTKPQTEPEASIDDSEPTVEYRTHVQGIGWQGWASDGTTAGTTGRALRVEALRMRIKDASGGISYQTHVQGIGWQDPVSDGALAGTTGKALRVEALKVKLTGAIAKTHSVWYRVHVQGTGWTAWKKNGAVAGTIGKSRRIEAVEAQVLPVGEEPVADSISASKGANPTLRYKAHVQKIGWMGWVSNGKVAGTSGRSLRIEAMYIKLSGVSGSMKYRTHVQGIGWQGWRANGKMTGTSGQSKRLEAIQIKLTGAVAQTYDIYYRTHVQKIGWMGWAKNGQLAGSAGYAYRMEAVQIKLVRKGAAAPANDGNTTSPYVGDVTTTYRVSLQNKGWQTTAQDGATAGKSNNRVQELRAKVSGIAGMSLRYKVCLQNGKWQAWKSDYEVAGKEGQAISAVRFQLLGNFKSWYNVWYRVHVTNKGWMGWAKNSALAGTDWVAGASTKAYAVDAVQVKVLRKTAKAPSTSAKPYEYLRQLNGVDISGHNYPFDMSRLDAEFVIIKATEGTDGTIYNPSYAQWADDAIAEGKLVGFYHYANAKKKNASDAIAEADCFYEAIKAYKGRAIACLDWESVTYASGYVDNTVFGTTAEARWCKTFLDRLKSKFGGTPFLYTGKYASQNDYWEDVASSYPLWGAQYASNDPVYGYQANPWTSVYYWGPWGAKPTIFQYSGNGWLENGGKPEGYNNQALDLDLFYGTRASWGTYLQ